MATGNEVLSWTSQDPRQSQLFGSYGVLYRFQVRKLSGRALNPRGASANIPRR